ncbi:neuropeptide FF receptor 2 [Biomphalaria glabrata]|nr:neuropeptide FF receptor 2 [Biomphalaria glabrata]
MANNLTTLAGQSSSSTGLVNTATLLQVDIAINCFFLPLVSLLGVINNSLNIIVLSKHSFQETTNIQLLSLSVCDLLCSVLQPLRRVHCLVERFDPVVGLTLKSFSMAYLFVLPDLFVSASILHTTLIAIERLVAVCFPLLVSRIFTPCRVKWTVLFLYIYAIGMLSPTLFLADFTWAYDSRYNTTRGAVVVSRFYTENYRIINEYANGTTPYLFITGPVVVILSCSAVTGFKVTIGRRATLAAMTSSASTKQVKELKVVRMLLTVCAINAAVAIPTVAINMFLMYSNSLILALGTFNYVLRSVIGLIYQFIASINFFIYVTMSSKFSKTLNNLLCHKVIK